MNCEEAKTRWHARHDDGASTHDRELDAHIASCPECRTYDAEMRLIAGGLEGLATEPVSEHQATTRLRLAPQRLGKLLRVAAAIALFAGGAWWVLRSVPQKGKQDADLRVADKTATESPARLGLQNEDRIGLSLRGQSAGKYLALRRPTTVANVQLYWLYPTLVKNDDRSGATDESISGGV